MKDNSYTYTVCTYVKHEDGKSDQDIWIGYRYEDYPGYDWIPDTGWDSQMLAWMIRNELHRDKLFHIFAKGGKLGEAKCLWVIDAREKSDKESLEAYFRDFISQVQSFPGN